MGSGSNITRGRGVGTRTRTVSGSSALRRREAAGPRVVLAIRGLPQLEEGDHSISVYLASPPVAEQDLCITGRVMEDLRTVPDQQPAVELEVPPTGVRRDRASNDHLL